MSRVLARSTRILDALAHRRLWRLGELAEVVALPPATCARLLASLVELGWVDQVAPRGAYRLGPRAHALAAIHPYQERLVQACRPVLDELVARLSQAVVLVALRGTTRQVLLLRMSRTTETEFLLGEDRDLYATATGRLLLAHLPSRRRARLIDQMGLPDAHAWPGVIDLDELNAELRQLRREGLAERHTPEWDSAAVWIGQWDEASACIGTFARPGCLAPDTGTVLLEAKKQLR